MDSRQLEDLGHGVRVVPLPDGGWQVRSADLRMPWSVRIGKTAGACVFWQEMPWQVTARDDGARGSRWTLQPWPDNEAMRTVYRLERPWIELLASERSSARRSESLRWGLLPLLPVLGLVPGDLQHRWHLEWGFPALAATTVSALIELAGSTMGVVHLLAASFGGAAVLPGPVGWLAPAAPLFLIESVVRLKQAVGAGQPIGSVIGLPVAAWNRHRPPEPSPQRPTVIEFDDDAGRLEMRSPIHRRDWAVGGVLRYRDRPFELAAVERMGRDWRYRFNRLVADDVPPTLSLMPSRPPQAADEPERGGPGLVSVAVTTALACLALGPDQERWGAFIGVRPALLTVLGAGAEVMGALVNLNSGGEAGPIGILFNLYLLGEGLFRMAGLVISGRPIGSVAGYALRPLMERSLDR